MSGDITQRFTIEGDGEPLFLIHGIGAARDTWRFAMPRLKEHFTVITYDLPGHGVSDIPDQRIDLDLLVEDLEAIRAATGIEKAHFAGHSLGGMIGPAYAKAYPDRVLSLGILSTAAFRTPEDSAKVFAVIEAMKDKGIENVLPKLTDRWFTDEFMENNPDIIERRLNQVLETNNDVFLNVFEVYASVEMSPWLSEVEARSLVLTGENDGGCNPYLNEQINAALPNSELVILPDYKHSLLLEAGDEVAQHLVYFILNRDNVSCHAP